MSNSKDGCKPDFEPQMDGEYEVIKGIKMESIPKAVGYGFLDDVWDSDGDSIVARAEELYQMDGEGMVKTVFAQGTDPRYAARILRKFADMLVGPRGVDIANLESVPGSYDHAQRLEDGEVIVCNLLQESERAREEDRREDQD